MPAVIASKCIANLPVRLLKPFGKVVDATGCVCIWVKHVLAGREVEGHDLEKTLRACAGASLWVTTRFNLHDGGEQVGVEAVGFGPGGDLWPPMLYFGGKDGRDGTGCEG